MEAPPPKRARLHDDTADHGNAERPDDNLYAAVYHGHLAAVRHIFSSAGPAAAAPAWCMHATWVHASVAGARAGGTAGT